MGLNRPQMNPEQTIKMMITSNDETQLNLEVVPYQHLGPSRVLYKVFQVDNDMKREKQPRFLINHDHPTGILRLGERILKRIQEMQEDEAIREHMHPISA